MQQLTNIQEIKSAVNQYGEIVVIKNKKNNVIIMSMDEYRNSVFDNETVEKLLKSENDIENGKTRNATEVVKELRKKYGF